jgi:hypothetical protein
MNIILGITLAVGIFFILAGSFLMWYCWDFGRSDQDIYAGMAKLFGGLCLGAGFVFLVIYGVLV